jgi:hypothetical protein
MCIFGHLLLDNNFKMEYFQLASQEAYLVQYSIIMPGGWPKKAMKSMC